MKPAAVDRQDPASAASTSERSARPGSQAGEPGAAGELIRGEPTQIAAGKPPVVIKLGGKEYRIRSDASEAWLQQVAGQVDRAMQNVRERTDTVDSLDVALLAALNLAREVLNLRSQLGTDDELAPALPDARLKDLIEQIELELPPVANS